LNGEELARTSRLTARVDNNAIGDGFPLYLHSFVITKSGEWSVVQQGMNAQSHLARRYHWHSASVRDFTSEPHTAIVGEPQGEILNLVDRRAAPAQTAMLTIVGQPVEASLGEIRKLTMPAHHDVRVSDVNLKRLGAVLALAHDQEIRNFTSLLLVEGLGPRTLQSLALVAEVIHGAPSRFSDPARFSFAHGGKDGHPFPVPLKTYDESLAVLRRSLAAARLEQSEKIEGFRGWTVWRARWRASLNLWPILLLRSAMSARSQKNWVGGRFSTTGKRDGSEKVQPNFRCFPIPKLPRRNFLEFDS